MEAYDQNRFAIMVLRGLNEYLQDNGTVIDMLGASSEKHPAIAIYPAANQNTHKGSVAPLACICDTETCNVTVHFLGKGNRANAKKIVSNMNRREQKSVGGIKTEPLYVFNLNSEPSTPKDMGRILGYHLERFL